MVSELGEDEELTKTEEIRNLKAAIETEIKKYEKDLGVGDIQQPQSALAAMVLVLDVLEDIATEEERPSLRRLKATYVNGKNQRADRVKVALDYSVFAGSQLVATQMHERFVDELNKMPWVETRVEARAADPLEGNKGVFVENQVVEVNLNKAPKAEPAKQQ
jgi:hypothetical protein